MATTIGKRAARYAVIHAGCPSDEKIRTVGLKPSVQHEVSSVPLKIKHVGS